MAGAVFVATPKPFEAHASVLLLSPPGGNAYIDGNPALFSAADVVALELDGPAARHRVGVSYAVVLDDSINEPLLLLSTKSRDASRAQQAIGALEKQIDATLQRVQDEAGAPRITTIRTQVLTQTPRAEITRYDAIERAILAVPITVFVFMFGRRAFRKRPRKATGESTVVRTSVVA